MEIGLDDIDVDDFFEPMSYWALQTGVWDGRPITYEDIPHFQEQTQKKILTLLFSQEAESLNFQRMMAYLALAGADENERALLKKDIEELKLTSDGMIIQTGFGKKTKKFWKKHWKKVVIGAVVVATVTVVVVVSVSSAGTATGPTVAVGAAANAAIDAQLNRSKKKKRKRQSYSGATGPDPKRLKTEKPISSIEIGGHSQPSAPSFLENESPITTPPSQTDFFEPPPVTKEMLRHTTPESLFPSSIQRKQESLLPHFDPHKSPHSSLAPPPTKPKIEKPLSLPKAPPTLEMLKQANRKEIFPSQKSISVPSKPTHSPFPLKLEGSSLPKCLEKKPKKSICCIGMINGMNTTDEFAKGHATYLKSFADQDIERVYNRTHGPLVDLAEVFFLNYLGISPNTSKELKANWTAFHEKYKDNPKVKYEQFCHSQGAIQVKNALESVPKEIRDRIIVIAIAPAVVISKKLCYDSYNYASKKDIVYLGEQICFSDMLDGIPIKSTVVSLNQKKELILLDPHPDAKGIDHDFQSPTFKKRIKRHITDYLAQNGEYE